ncbi:MAG: hypothetical protein DRN49_03125 [Thaumarchaeota archaeon]|nr:MAG: hypothetical protein DRN49_03125 [Nitrososphaerota archaeon]
MTWRRIYQSNRLVEKYGVLGKVAARYLLAGYSIRIQSNFILASKEGSNLIIGVAINDKNAEKLITEITEASKKLSRIPVIVLYGKNKWRNETIKAIKDHGITYKLVRE